MLAEVGALAAIVLGFFVVTGLARWLGGGPAPMAAGAGPGERGRVRQLVNLAVGLSAALLGFVWSSVWSAAAMVAALSAAAGATVERQVSRRFGGAGFRVPSLRRVPAATGAAVSAEGVAAAFVAALALATLASWLGLVGPGDAGLVVLGGVLGMLTERSLATSSVGRAGGGHAARLIGTLSGALIALLLVVFLP